LATAAGLPSTPHNAAHVIVLCRHGATDANVAGAFLSNDDPPLNAIGRAQCARARDALDGVELHAALCSPMLRCVQSVEIIAPRVPRRVLDPLREVDFGTWEGRTLQWLLEHDPAGVAQRRDDPVRFRPPGGESFSDASQRLTDVAAELRDARGAIVVGHRGTLGVLERLLRNLPLDSPDVLPLEPGEFRILS
jgi:broad specificity phosphatase PhoE